MVHDRVKESERTIYNRGYGTGDLLPDPELMTRLLARREAWLDARLATLPRGAQVLDVGCGSGATSLRLAQKGFRVTGIDISDARIEEAQERARAAGLTVTFLRGDAESLDFRAESFDAVCATAILHHLPDVERDLVLFRGLLKPGGCVIATEPGLLNPLAFVRRRFFPTSVHTPDERPFVPWRFFAMFRRHFQRVTGGYFYVVSVAAPVIGKAFGSGAGRFALAVLTPLDRVLCRLPGIRELAWIINVHAIK
jgi:ubiquinone/menaquinone biosynthesis C-methylase UbiE